MYVQAALLAGIVCALLLQHTHQGEVFHTSGLPGDAVQTGMYYATIPSCCFEVVQVCIKIDHCRCMTK